LARKRVTPGGPGRKVEASAKSPGIARGSGEEVNVPSADDYAKRVAEIVGGKGDLKQRVRLKWKWETVPEAKRHLASIRQMHRELRQVKREINAEMKAI